MNRKFSRIENLWPRDGSCPLSLRSKHIFNNCFRIIKAQKISRGDAAHVRGSPFAPNEVPAPVCAAALAGKPVSRPVGLWNFQGAFPVKEKYRPCSIAMDFVGWNSGKMNRVCCGAVNLLGIIHGEAVFRMNTTTSCEWLLTNPQNQWDLWQRISWFVEYVKMSPKKLFMNGDNSKTSIMNMIHFISWKNLSCTKMIQADVQYAQ